VVLHLLLIKSPQPLFKIKKMTQDELKLAAARKALDYVVDGSIIGIGSGSTVNIFIAELGKVKHRVKAAVSSSEKSSQLLREQGIEVLDLNSVESYPVYIDGADEINYKLEMIKGGGAALTREKIVSAVADKFVCIVDQSKLKDVLGAFALPVEVIPMARAQVARELAKLGGTPKWREGVITDNGNIILDVSGLRIEHAAALEAQINQITGVVTNGLFASRPASIALIASPTGVNVLSR
jgi:ribose 5-phosphate isomerase A